MLKSRNKHVCNLKKNGLKEEKNTPCDSTPEKEKWKREIIKLKSGGESSYFILLPSEIINIVNKYRRNIESNGNLTIFIIKQFLTLLNSLEDQKIIFNSLKEIIDENSVDIDITSSPLVIPFILIISDETLEELLLLYIKYINKDIGAINALLSSYNVNIRIIVTKNKIIQIIRVKPVIINYKK